MSIPIEINVHLDADRFEAYLHVVSRAAGAAADEASRDAADFLRDEIRFALETFPHPLSIATPSPAFRGPVGMLTDGSLGRWPRIPGHLRDSIQVEFTPFTHSARVYSTAAYSRIQEFGGFTGGKGEVPTSVRVRKTSGGSAEVVFGERRVVGHHGTYLPPRPYFRTTTQSTFTRAEVEHIYWDKWRDAMLAAVNFGF